MNNTQVSAGTMQGFLNPPEFVWRKSAFLLSISQNSRFFLWRTISPITEDPMDASSLEQLEALHLDLAVFCRCFNTSSSTVALVAQMPAHGEKNKPSLHDSSSNLHTGKRLTDPQ